MDPSRLLNSGEPAAWVGGQLGSDLVELSDDPRVLDTTGRWAVCLDFEGRLTAARFGEWRPMSADGLPDGWSGPTAGEWRSSLDSAAYRAAVESIRGSIARGDVYQANLCRVLTAPTSQVPNPFALARVLTEGNPAPYAGAIRLPAVGEAAPRLVTCASPELYLARSGEGRLLSRPIKGTARTADGFLAKDTAENIMIVDLVRNDLSVVATVGSVEVPDFLVTEHHPGLVHLVSAVAARQRPDATWGDVFAATFPPGSVTGAPKSSALRIIGELEPTERGPYCGAFGWIDADTGEAELAVAIRTFWFSDGDRGSELNFGTGAGITWGSDPEQEWNETELKAARLVGLASGAVPAG
ncbi:MAG: chorismate-binding protein [Actinobacteria bacterium]|nr:chorismate-binding protein [Actinomycetota bacterium]MCB9412651.1 chorismate-binding protein [Actinomycetota bacterium]